MDDTEIRELAVKAFIERYPEDRGVTSTDVARDVFGGFLAVVRSIEKDGNKNEELVYVYPDKSTRVFDKTEEMAAFLEKKARQPSFIDVMSNNAFISGTVFLLLIIGTFVAGFSGDTFRNDAFAALTGILGTAAGFYFSTQRRT